MMANLSIDSNVGWKFDKKRNKYYRRNERGDKVFYEGPRPLWVTMDGCMYSAESGEYHYTGGSAGYSQPSGSGSSSSKKKSPAATEGGWIWSAEDNDYYRYTRDGGIEWYSDYCQPKTTSGNSANSTGYEVKYADYSNVEFANYKTPPSRAARVPAAATDPNKMVSAARDPRERSSTGRRANAVSSTAGKPTSKERPPAPGSGTKMSSSSASLADAVRAGHGSARASASGRAPATGKSSSSTAKGNGRRPKM